MPDVPNYKDFYSKPESYHGDKGAGCLFVAKDTGRILLAHRADSGEVEEPGTWGTWGGKIEANENPRQCVAREVEEETGYSGIKKIQPLYVYRDGDFEYHNFLVVVPFEFTPQLNWENDSSAWVEYGQWPEPLHFGLQYLLQHSGEKIKHVIELIKKKNDTMMESTVASDEREHNFKRWFGNSVVRTADGKPLMVYHGTNQPVHSFAKVRRGMSTASRSSKKGFFFTDNPEVAERYAAKAGATTPHDISAHEKQSKKMKDNVDRLEQRARLTGDWEPYEKAMEEWEQYEIDTVRQDDTLGQNIIPVFLRIENPFVHDFEGQFPGVGGIDNAVEAALKNGNDGVILKNIIDPSPSSNHYVVFNASQIKSAVGNNGKYGNTSDITKEAMDAPPAQVQPASTNAPAAHDMTNAYLVAATVWGEGRSEGQRGMQAVLNVIMNRAHHDFSKAKNVILKNKQFSFWNGVSDPVKASGDLAAAERANTAEDPKQYQIALALVDKAMTNGVPDITGGATFYMNKTTATDLSWEKDMAPTIVIGKHTFFKPKKHVHEASAVTTPITVKPEGIFDVGVFGYKIQSPYSYVSYGYEPDARLFHLYMVQTPKEEDRDHGHAKEVLQYFFGVIRQKQGALDIGPYTASGEMYLRHVLVRMAQEYNIRLV